MLFPARGRHPVGLATGLVVLLTAGSGPGRATDQVAGERRGLATTFVEVQLEDVPIGGRYRLDMKPVDVENRSVFTMVVQLLALVPRPDEMRGGFDPLPDPAWVQFEPRELTITAGGRASARVVLSVPDDPALIGRRFEASIFIRGVPVESPAVGIGLKPRLYFSLGTRDGPDRIVKLDTAPRFPRVTPFESGVRAGTMRFAAGHFTAQNQTGETMAYEIAPDAAALARSGDGGAVLLPDMAWVSVSPGTLVLPPWSSAPVSVEVDMPIDARYFGKAYVVPLHSIARRAGTVPVDVYNRVVIVVPDPGKVAGAPLP